MFAATDPQKAATVNGNATKPKDKSVATFLLIWVVAVLLLFLVIGATLGHLLKGFADKILDNRTSNEVYPGIFVGAKNSVEYDGRGLANQGIINVLNVTPVADPEEIRNGIFPGVKGGTNSSSDSNNYDVNGNSGSGGNSNANANGYHYLQVPIKDEASENIIRYFPITNQFIGSALASGEPVLVHCHSGISRSVTVVAAYLISLGMTPEYALTQIKMFAPTVIQIRGFADNWTSITILCIQLK